MVKNEVKFVFLTPEIRWCNNLILYGKFKIILFSLLKMQSGGEKIGIDCKKYANYI